MNNISSSKHNETVLFKPTGTVHIANSFSLIERKLLNAIIWHSQKHRFTTDEKTFPIRDVFMMLGLEKSKNNDVITSALRTLVGTIIEWNILNTDRVAEWGVCTFLASGKISSGELKYRLNPEIIERINHPTLFAKIQILVQAKVKKRHALVLYEYFIEALSRMKRNTLRTTVPLDKIHPMLGTEGTPFKFFNRDVIKPSIKEINDHTDIDVSFETIKSGRKITEIIFVITRKEMVQTSISFDDFKGLDNLLDETGSQAEKDKKELEVLLKEHGVSIKISKELVSKFDYDRIMSNVNYTVNEDKHGRIDKTKASFLVSAIRSNYCQGKLGTEKTYHGISKAEIEKNARPGESYGAAAARLTHKNK